MKIVIILIVSMFFLIGCKEKMYEKGAAIKLAGAYSGIIPCPDCDSISYEITLKEDMTYRERAIYVGKTTSPITSTGTWKFEDANNIRLYKKTEEMSYFLITKEGLVILEGSGKKYTGDKADKYKLIPGGLQNVSALRTDINQSNSINGLWKLAEINGQKSDVKNYTTGIPDLTIIEADNKFTSNSGCNTTSGGVQIKADLITFTKVYSTKTECPGTGESEYISTLKSVDSFTTGNDLLILKTAGKIVLQFVR